MDVKAWGGIATLLEKASPEEQFRAALKEEGNELIRMGKTSRMRHSEVTQIQLQFHEHVGYLFHRMFALIRLCLRATRRTV